MVAPILKLLYELVEDLVDLRLFFWLLRVLFLRFLRLLWLLSVFRLLFLVLVSQFIELTLKCIEVELFEVNFLFLWLILIYCLFFLNRLFFLFYSNLLLVCWLTRVGIFLPRLE